MWTIECGFIRHSITSVVSRWTSFSGHRRGSTFGQALDGLTALDREGKLDGRPRDKAQLLPAVPGREQRPARQLADAGAYALEIGCDDAGAGAVSLVAHSSRLAARAGARLDLMPAAAETLCAMKCPRSRALFTSLADRSPGAQGGSIIVHDAQQPAIDLKTLRAKLAERAVGVLWCRQQASGLRHQSRIEVDGFLEPIRADAKYERSANLLRTAGSGSGSSTNRDSRNATTQTRKP